MTVQPPLITLRDYQEETIAGIYEAWTKQPNTLAVLATGLGKTIVFLELLDELTRGGARAVIIAHRKELIEQPIDKARQFFPELAPRMGMVRGQKHADHHAQVVVATVQTLSKPSRLQALLAGGPITYVVVDEAHHAVSPSYMQVIDAIRQHNPIAKLLGVTATPKRADDQGLIRIFDSVAAVYDTRWGIRNGYLSPVKAKGIALPCDISKVRLNRGDYAAGELGSILAVDNVEAVVVRAWTKLADTRPTVAFCATVKQSKQLCHKFNRYGIKTAHLDGTTPQKEREAILASFVNGEIQIITNCDVLGEGFDHPAIACVMMVAPTRSISRYIQRVGRGLRRADEVNKEDCLVIDFVPEKGGRNLRLGSKLLGKVRPPKDNIEPPENSLDDPKKKVAQFTAKGVMAFDYSLFQDSLMAWYVEGRLASCPTDQNQILVLLLPKPTARIQRTLLFFVKTEPKKEPIIEELGDMFTPIEYIFEDVEAEYITAIHLAEKDRPWRSQPPSEAQLNLAQKLGIKTKGLNKGQIANRLSHFFAVQALRQKYGWGFGR